MMALETFDDILTALDGIQERVQQIRDIVLANLIMIGEIHAARSLHQTWIV